MEKEGGSQTQQRKDEHLRLCLDSDVSSGVSNGFADYHFEYDALPEIALCDVSLSCEAFGKNLRAPILIGSMTGGTEWAGELNFRLARVASKLGIGMALGSQRVMVESPQAAASFQVREECPELPLLLGNIGAVQLNYGLDVQALKTLVSEVKADGLIFHLNPLQEAIQPEGDTNFRGLREKMKQVVEELPFPCLVKEVGAGISQKTARKLGTIGFAGVEASGVGGTSWARIEGYRSGKSLGERLRGFGVPTNQSILACRQAFPEATLIASGGIRTGHDIAVSLALGADLVAMARPVLEKARQSEEALEDYLKEIIEELSIISFCTGAKNIKELKTSRLFRRGRTE